MTRWPERLRSLQLPLLAVLVVVAAGVFGAAVLHAWRVGSGVIGAGLLLGGLLRLALPRRYAGMLAVRGRPLDVGVLLVLGSTVVVLSRAIPSPQL